MQNSMENLSLLSNMTWIHDLAALRTVLTGGGGKEVGRLVEMPCNRVGKANTNTSQLWGGTRSTKYQIKTN